MVYGCPCLLRARSVEVGSRFPYRPPLLKSAREAALTDHHFSRLRPPLPCPRPVCHIALADHHPIAFFRVGTRWEGGLPLLTEFGLDTRAAQGKTTTFGDPESISTPAVCKVRAPLGFAGRDDKIEAVCTGRNGHARVRPASGPRPPRPLPSSHQQRGGGGVPRRVRTVHRAGRGLRRVAPRQPQQRLRQQHAVFDPCAHWGGVVRQLFCNREILRRAGDHRHCGPVPRCQRAQQRAYRVAMSSLHQLLICITFLLVVSPCAECHLVKGRAVDSPALWMSLGEYSHKSLWNNVP
eukprot:gene6622-biopygen13459